MAHPIRVGSRFSSFSELQESIKEFEREQKITYWRRDSRTLETAAKRGMKVDPIAHKELEYYSVTFSCIKGGRSFTSKSSATKGQRPNQRTFRDDCKSEVRVRFQDGCLAVVKLNIEHNHPVHEDSFKFLPKNRRLEEGDREELRKILETRPNMKLVLAHLRKRGKFVTMKDLANEAAKLPCKLAGAQEVLSQFACSGGEPAKEMHEAHLGYPPRVKRRKLSSASTSKTQHSGEATVTTDEVECIGAFSSAMQPQDQLFWRPTVNPVNDQPFLKVELEAIEQPTCSEPPRFQVEPEHTEHSLKRDVRVEHEDMDQSYPQTSMQMEPGDVAQPLLPEVMVEPEDTEQSLEFVVKLEPEDIGQPSWKPRVNFEMERNDQLLLIKPEEKVIQPEKTEQSLKTVVKIKPEDIDQPYPQPAMQMEPDEVDQPFLPGVKVEPEEINQPSLEPQVTLKMDVDSEQSSVRKVCTSGQDPPNSKTDSLKTCRRRLVLEQETGKDKVWCVYGHISAFPGSTLDTKRDAACTYEDNGAEDQEQSGVSEAGESTPEDILHLQGQVRERDPDLHKIKTPPQDQVTAKADRLRQIRSPGMKLLKGRPKKEVKKKEEESKNEFEALATDFLRKMLDKLANPNYHFALMLAHELNQIKSAKRLALLKKKLMDLVSDAIMEENPDCECDV